MTRCEASFAIRWLLRRGNWHGKVLTTIISIVLLPTDNILVAIETIDEFIADVIYLFQVLMAEQREDRHYVLLVSLRLNYVVNYYE